MKWWKKALLFTGVWIALTIGGAVIHTEVVLKGKITAEQDEAISEVYSFACGAGLGVIWVVAALLRKKGAPMKTTSTLVLLLLAACSTAVAQLSQPERELNLRSLQAFSARAIGTRLFLSVTGQPPVISSLVKQMPVPLNRRDQGVKPKIQVRLDKDIVGMAEVSGISEQSLPLARGTNAPKTTLANVILTFETAEQAKGAAQAVHIWDAAPTPLQRRKVPH